MQKYQILFREVKDIQRFVDIVNQFECDIDLKRGSIIMDAKSLMGVLAMSEADDLELVIHDTNCDRILTQIQPYVSFNKSA